MSGDTPLVFKLGRLPNDPSWPRVKLGAHLRDTPGQALPASVNWHDAVKSWGMLGNAEYGCCVFSGNGHLVELLTTYGDAPEHVVTETQVLAEYSRATGFNPAEPSTDQGAAVQTGLADLHKHGLAGVTIAAFAEVNPNDMSEVMTALLDLGGLSVGVNLPGAAQDQFADGQPWDLVPDDGGIEGGHCVVLAGYDPDYLYFITWGQVQKATYPWWERYVEEAWAVVSDAWVAPGGKDPEGVNLATLGREFTQITGHRDPLDPPRTADGAVVNPLHELGELADDLRDLLSKGYAWLDRHGL